jgi:hypothetical protein
MTVVHKKKLVVKEIDYELIIGNIYNLGVYGILRQCVLEHERPMILVESHDGIVGGHYVGKDIVHKILHRRIWWPTLHKDAKEYF